MTNEDAGIGQYGCYRCQRRFAHEPMTLVASGYPAMTYLFCSTDCRSKWLNPQVGSTPVQAGEASGSAYDTSRAYLNDRPRVMRAIAEVTGTPPRPIDHSPSSEMVELQQAKLHHITQMGALMNDPSAENAKAAGQTLDAVITAALAQRDTPPVSEMVESIQVQLLRGALATTCEAAPTGGPCPKCGHASIMHAFKQLLAALSQGRASQEAEIARLKQDNALLQLALAEEGGFLQLERQRKEAAGASLASLADAYEKLKEEHLGAHPRHGGR